MVWTFPPALIAGGGTASLYFTEDTLVGDLYAYLGNPSEELEVTVVADNCDVGNVIITSSFNGGCTFNFTAVNGGRFLGLGGDGGKGGDDEGANGTPGVRGNSGGHAIQSSGFPVNIDVDDGYLLGGGGGGGGGSFDDLGTSGTPGGGGGGGQGFGTTVGGAAGTPIGIPIASAGGNGSAVAPGSGGAGGSGIINTGGDGGTFGYAGGYGQMAAPNTFGFSSSPSAGCGGAGGNGGNAFYGTNGSIATFSGAKSEATLRSENRILGETKGRLVIVDHQVTAFHVGTSTTAAGWSWLNDSGGTLRRKSGGNLTSYTQYWYNYFDDITASDYEVRYVAGTVGGLGGSSAWDLTFGVADTWYNLANIQTMEINANSTFDRAIALVQMGRAGEEKAIANGLISAAIEWESGA
jgi:hypothetical protein